MLNTDDLEGKTLTLVSAEPGTPLVLEACMRVSQKSHSIWMPGTETKAYAGVVKADPDPVERDRKKTREPDAIFIAKYSRLRRAGTQNNSTIQGGRGRFSLLKGEEENRGMNRSNNLDLYEFGAGEDSFEFIPGRLF